jgi:hypothetical protein
LPGDRRNPYFILGLDYGASKDEARRATARVLRRLKTTPDAQYTAADVTWALHEVEQVNDDPDAGVHIFRVPSSPGPIGLPGSEGLFAPAATPEVRSSPPSTEADLERLATAALAELASSLLAEYSSLIDTIPSYSSKETR